LNEHLLGGGYLVAVRSRDRALAMTIHWRKKSSTTKIKMVRQKCE
jgi:hypothetical protein